MPENLHVHNVEDDVSLTQPVPGGADLAFVKLAAEMRVLTEGRGETTSEDLLREGRDER